MNRPRLIFTLVAVFAFISLPAAAKIRCDEGFQAVNGSEIATPYCQDEYLAQIASKHGMRVTGAAIRSDPQAKEDACRLVGYDIRMQDHCTRYNDGDRRN
jgi:hypothetical protein